MRTLVWLVVLAIVAVVAATVLEGSGGLVSIYWGEWRTDLSLKLFVILFVAAGIVLMLLLRGLETLVGLPERARAWHISRLEQAAQTALRDALANNFGGRFSRAQKSAQRALELHQDVPELEKDREFAQLAHLLAATSLHRLQDHAKRDEQLKLALKQPASGAAAHAAEEGARMIAAEWALEDRDEDRALELLGQLPPGVGRRTQALRLSLQAHRMAGEPMEALRTARLLAKHQGFSAGAAQGLLRSLAFEALAEARDAEQVRRTWSQFDAADRRDAFVAARAATRMANFGQPGEARIWLLPFWEGLGELGDDERAAVARALVAAREGVPNDWLPRIETATQQCPRDAAIGFAAGMLYAEHGLWGKARHQLERAAADDELAVAQRRQAWVTLARLAERDEDAARTADCYRRAAEVE